MLFLCACIHFLRILKTTVWAKLLSLISFGRGKIYLLWSSLKVHDNEISVDFSGGTEPPFCLLLGLMPWLFRRTNIAVSP